MGTSSKAIAEQLREVASGQHGFFTAKQAVEAGYADSVHAYHVKNGDWIKVHRGIYRLADQEQPPWPELVIWSLWSRRRDDRPQGVYSGETALAIHEVVKRGKGPLEMTVPTNFRRNSELPAEVKLFKEDLADSDIEARDGYLVTTLDKAMQDASERGTNPKLLAHLTQLDVPELTVETPSNITKPKIMATSRQDVVRTVKVVWDEHWDGPVQRPSWGDGRSFDEALDAGED